MQSISGLLKRIAAFFAGIAAFFASLFGGGGGTPAGPTQPPETTQPAVSVSVLEERYAGFGDYAVSYLSFPAEDETIGKYSVWYPTAMETDGRAWPALLYLNGSSWRASWQTEIFRRFASYGIIAVGTEDSETGTGASAEQTLAFLLRLNEEEGSPLYGKIDPARIGIAGFSQGGAAALRAASVLDCAGKFCTVAAVSPSYEERAAGFGWGYDPARITVPVLLLAGTKGNEENGQITSLEEQRKTFGALGGPKAAARKTGVTHNDIRLESLGCLTAWMAWRLCGDETAAGIFVGDAPELALNEGWQDVRLEL